MESLPRLRLVLPVREGTGFERIDLLKDMVYSEHRVR
jgi:hypothetical protein